MEEKRVYCFGTKREAKERDFGDENVHTVLFAAGTALVMAILKRFVLVMFFVEQWRHWVFLLLNLVLLAIFFTSMHPSTAHDQNQQGEENAIKRKKPQRGCGSESGKGDRQGNVKMNKVDNCEEKKRKKVESINEDGANHKTDEKDYDDDDGEEEEEEEEEKENPRLSKEELNERVEAFIATFRRQLVSDAIGGRRDHYHSCFSKKKMIRENINGGFIMLERKEVF